MTAGTNHGQRTAPPAESRRATRQSLHFNADCGRQRRH
jgi:hypothetical protein